MAERDTRSLPVAVLMESGVAAPGWRAGDEDEDGAGDRAGGEDEEGRLVAAGAVEEAGGEEGSAGAEDDREGHAQAADAAEVLAAEVGGPDELLERSVAAGGNAQRYEGG